MNRKVVKNQLIAGTRRLYRYPVRSSLNVTPTRTRHVASLSERLLPPSVRISARGPVHTTLGDALRPMAPGLFGILPLNIAPEVPSAMLVLSIITGLPAALWLYKVE